MDKIEKIKVAVYRHVKFDFEVVKDHDMYIQDKDHVRVSEVEEITFKSLDHNTVMLKEVEALKAVKEEIQAATQVKVNEINDKIGKLLAIGVD